MRPSKLDELVTENIFCPLFVKFVLAFLDEIEKKLSNRTSVQTSFDSLVTVKTYVTDYKIRLVIIPHSK